MTECHCGTQVPDNRRTCPNCGIEVNPDAVDPGIQDQRRQTTIIAELRGENRELEQKLANEAERHQEAEATVVTLRQELTTLAGELRNVQDEIVVLKEMLRGVDDRQRLIRARFESMDIPMFRPFEATQASLFPQPDNDPKSKGTR